MSEPPNPEFDPASPTSTGEADGFTRRRVGPGKIAIAFLLAVLITALAFGILSVVLWAIASVFH